VTKDKNTKKRTKLLANEHTGRVRPHKHTSYGSLFIILSIAIVPVLFISRTATADLPPPPPVTGSYQTYAVVPAPVPATAPQIGNISDGKVYTSADPIAVSGSCPGTTLVKIYKNNVMGGAALCKGGSFQIQMDLFQGSNTLVARAYNANDVPSPDSTPVIVTLQIPGVNIGVLNSAVSQFYITSDVYYRGVEAGSAISWPITIAGGQPPYAISVGWGDGKTDLISQAAPGKFTITHTYSNPATNGSYTIFINSADSNGSKSYLQLFAMVKGSGVAAAISNGSTGSGHRSIITITTALAAISASAVIVLGIWIGEKRGLALLKHNTGAVA
jgi:hypothetical protein